MQINISQEHNIYCKQQTTHHVGGELLERHTHRATILETREMQCEALEDQTRITEQLNEAVLQTETLEKVDHAHATE